MTAPLDLAAPLAALRSVNAIYDEEAPGGWTTSGWNRFVTATLDFHLAHAHELAAALEAAQRDNERLRTIMASLISFALAAPSNDASRSVRNRVVEQARAALAATERIADDNGDELEHGAPDFPGQFPEPQLEPEAPRASWRNR